MCCLTPPPLRVAERLEPGNMSRQAFILTKITVTLISIQSMLSPC
uniref:Uncharacterized protein n=1 Tax=Anguilla anguilla TaxID=7936 RepID=A0A0E9QLE1_ANGAN